MKRYSEITYKYLLEKKKRTIFTILGIIMSLALISGVGFLGLSLKDYMYNMCLRDSGKHEVIFHQVTGEQAKILKNNVDLKAVGIKKFDGEYTVPSLNKENNLYLILLDKGEFKNTLSYILEEGDYPQNDNEIILSSHAKEYLGVKVNDTISLSEVVYDEVKSESRVSDNIKEYKVVGFADDMYKTGNFFNIYTILGKIEDNSEYDVSFSTVTKNNKIDIIYQKAKELNINDENIGINNRLLSLIGQGENESFNYVIKGIVIFVFLLIVTATAFLIYNSINISVAERIDQFGVIRSIGATPKQIRNLVFREGILMCLVSVPFGIFFGYVGVLITVKLLESQIANTLGGGVLILKFYPVVILFTLVLGVITILLAAFEPARNAGKVNVINILKGNFNQEKIKYSKGNLIRKLFGIEGWVAYKNIRKNAKRFRVTILSLSISLVLFIVFTNLNMKRTEELTYLQRTKVTQGYLYVHDKPEEIQEKMQNIKGIEKVYSVGTMGANILLDENDLTDEYKLNYPDSLIGEDDSDIMLLSYNDAALGEIDINDGLKDNEIVLINSRAQYAQDGKLENIPITNYKEGDIIRIPKTSLEVNKFENDNYMKLIQNDKANNNCYEFKIKKIIDRSPFSDDYNNSLAIIINERNFLKFNHDSWINMDVGFKYPDLNNKQQIDDISRQVQEVADEYGITFFDELGDQKKEAELWSVINVFVYGFISIVTLIAIVNVINTITLNILLKKKEYGTLETIGMDRRQLKKMVILEGMLHGIISSVVGGILAIGLTTIAIKIVSRGFTFSNNIYLAPFVIGFIVNLTIVLIASLIPLNKLNKMSLIETIKNIE